MNTENKYMKLIPYWIRVRDLLKRTNKSQVDFCNETGIHIGTMKSWQVNNRIPGSDESVRIAKALNTTVEYLVLGNEPDIQDHSAEVIAAVEKALQQFKTTSPE